MHSTVKKNTLLCVYQQNDQSHAIRLMQAKASLNNLFYHHKSEVREK